MERQNVVELDVSLRETLEEIRKLSRSDAVREKVDSAVDLLESLLELCYAAQSVRE